MARKVVAVTGGIGAGKSTIAAWFESVGAHVFSADASARAAVAPGTTAHDALMALVPNCFADAQLRRERLAEAIFSNPELRQQVEAIIHPWVRADIAHHIAECNAELIVVDIPLLAETRDRAAVRAEFDYVVCVWAPTNIRRERLLARGLSDADIAARMASQASDEVRHLCSDVVVPNQGSLQQVHAKLEEIAELLHPSPGSRK